MAARAVGRVGGGGRARIVMLMLAFLVITGGVILRRSFGIAAASALRDLESKRAATINEKLRLEGEIRAASSRARLLPVAEGLGLRVPADSQVISISRTAP
jgi:cell division protein FtsL